MNSSVIVSPTPELRQLVSELTHALQDAAMQAASPYRDRRGAAAYLGCSVRSIDEDVAEGRLPRKFYRGHPRFAVADLDKLVTPTR